jgi:hypothetical protein
MGKGRSGTGEAEMPSALEFVPLSVYLKSVYEPDAEYVVG